MLNAKDRVFARCLRITSIRSIYRKSILIECMDIKKFIQDYNLSDYSIGLGGCRTKNLHFDSCAYDVVVFDQSAQQDDIIRIDGQHLVVVVHHASFSETDTRKLLGYTQLDIVHDESWNLHMLLSKLRQKHDLLFSDFAKNSLIESQFCTQKARESLDVSSVSASCWQKCAVFCLASAILSINHQYSGPSHTLELLRSLGKTPVNQHIFTVIQTVGMQRASTILLERMLKSTIGFSDLVEKNGHSSVILQKYDHFVKNSMLSDCYFYLCHINKDNFIKIKDTLHEDESLPYILKTAFDIEADPSLIERQSDLLQRSCSCLLKDIANP